MHGILRFSAGNVRGAIVILSRSCIATASLQDCCEANSNFSAHDTTYSVSTGLVGHLLDLGAA